MESSIQEHRNVVKSRVDQDLDKLKETYNGMDSLLSQVAVAIAASLPDNLSNELNVIYFPQLGFNIAIPLNEQGRPVYNGGNEEWTQVFSTENRAYFKDFRMREMDERLGDMYGSICGMLRFKEIIRRYTDPLQKKKLRSYIPSHRKYWVTRKCLLKHQMYVARLTGSCLLPCLLRIGRANRSETHILVS